MYAKYLKFTVLVATLMFVTGFISLAVLSTTKVLPAQKGLNFEQVTCRVTDSEISCEKSNCSDSVPKEGHNSETSRCLKVYVLCGDDQFIDKNKKQIGHLLRKDINHLNDKVNVTRISICVFKYH